MNKEIRFVDDLQLTKLHDWSSKPFKLLIRFLSQQAIDPNWFTMLGLLMAFVTAYCLAMEHWWWALITLITVGILDVIDGGLARSLPNRSERLQKMGVFFDPYIDRITDIIIGSGFAAYAVWNFFDHTMAGLWFVICAFAAGPLNILSSYIRILLKSMDQRLSVKKSLTRAGFHIQIGALCLLEGGFNWTYLNKPIMYWGIWFIFWATFAVFIKRSWQAFRTFKSPIHSIKKGG